MATARAKPYSPVDLYTSRRQRVYRGAQLSQIAFPLGGIGAGCVCLNGYGGLQDFSVQNRPALTAAQEVDGYSDAAFAVLHIPGKNITRLVEGPFPKGKIYAQGTKPEGILGGGHEGLPRFRKCSFRGEFPFGMVSLSDPVVGLDVEVSGLALLFRWTIKILRSPVPYSNTRSKIELRKRSTFNFRSTSPIYPREQNHLGLIDPGMR